jgi:ABC-2 type transport system ATP-binding protein
MEPIIEVRNLVKRYRKATENAVDDVSFSVAPGELFALLGPNGAGKTTTISILTTTLSPTSGDVRVAGNDIQRDATAVRKNVGIIFQKPSLDANLTAEQNIRLHATLYGLYPFRPTYSMMPAGYKRQLEELSAVLDIQREVFEPIKTFSGGMKRKIEIVRSLLHRPRVLFLDEPTIGLDPSSRRSMWEYLRKVRAETETTVFLTTHYLEEAEQADRICIINRGRVVAYGTPEQIKGQLLESYLLVDADDRDRLLAELQERGLNPTGGPPFRVPVNGRSPHQIIKSIDTPLTVVRVHAPTLEDAYLAIVEGARSGR